MASSSGRRTPQSGLRSPSVRRRGPSFTAAVVKTEPAASTPPSSPPPAPSETTNVKVMRLLDSVAHVVARELLRPPVYTVPQLSHSVRHCDTAVTCGMSL